MFFYDKTNMTQMVSYPRQNDAADMFYPIGPPKPIFNSKLIDLEEMDINQKMAFLRNHKEWKNMVKWEALDEHEKTWKTNGLVNLNYSMLKKKSLSDTGHATMLTMDVKLNGNHSANDKCGVDFKGDWNKSSR